VQPDIEKIESRIAYLEELKQWVFNAFEVGQNLNEVFTHVKADKSDVEIFDEIIEQLEQLYGFSKMAFLVVDEEDNDFSLISCQPRNKQNQIQAEVDAQIKCGNFAWALSQTKACVVHSVSMPTTTVLHVLSTKSRVRGMFLGVTEKKVDDVNDSMMSFLTMLLLGIANTLESRELYRYVHEQNANLEKLVASRTKELEEARIEAETASTVKSTFLANMSHEIRTPLTSVIGYAEWLESGSIDNSERQEATGAILRTGRHLLKIINEILDISKIESQKIDLEIMTVPLHNMLDELGHLLSVQAQSKGLKFEVKHNFPLPRCIMTDPTRLKQIMLNLCSNAIKFTDEGEVSVDVAYEKQSGKIKFSVKDSGIGIPDESIDSIFESFTQADSSTTRLYGGTGLGLNISKRLAEMLGGTIQVSSVPGEGSCFAVTVDPGTLNENELAEDYEAFSIKDVTRAETNDPSKLASLTGKVLVADDNSDNQRLVGFYLSKRGIKVVMADNGQQAVEHALVDDFNLVLMDMQMPVVDGLEATELLCSSGYSAPIVALTANASKEDMDKCLAAGCVDFLTKPFDKRRLNQVLEQYLPLAGEEETEQESGTYDEEFEALTQKFLLSLPDKKFNIEIALASQDWAELKSLMHQLKGSSGGYGFSDLGSAAAKVEALIKNQNIDDVDVMIKDFDAEYQKVVGNQKRA